MTRLLLVIALCALGGIAGATPRTSKAGKVSIDVPASWRVIVTDDTMKGESGDKEVALLSWVVDSADVAAATKKLDGELYGAVAHLTWGKPRKARVHGLRASYVDGTGRAVGGTLDVKVIVVGPTPTKKGLIVVAAVTHAKLAAHAAEIQTLFQSIRRAK